MTRVAPFPYERSQAEYYLRLLQNYLPTSADSGRPAALVDLTSPEISYFTDMRADERGAFITDIGTLTDDPALVELANTVKIASLEMNGGLGSSMGTDPALNQSKANGIKFAARYDGTTVDLSLMDAKMMHATQLASKLGTVHFIPANSTITELGWQTFLEERNLAALPGPKMPRMTNVEFLATRQVQVHPSVIQQAFPRLDPATNEVVQTDNPVGALAPGGHGQFLYHLYFSGKLDEIAAAGMQILVMANADNINATPNPIIAAKMVRDDVTAALVSTDRTPLDAKGGIFVVKDGKLDIIELGSVPPDQKELFTQIGLREGDGTQPFNTNTVYINVPLLLKHLEGLAKAEGEEAVHTLLMPETIPNKKPAGIQLEGAIGSTVLKLPGVRLFNVQENQRSDEFTPLKTPIDAVYYLDSDAYAYDTTTHQLQRHRTGPETTFNVGGWDGWKNVITTRHAFGLPSFRDLDSLTISGAINCPDAIWRGTVEIINEDEGTLDLTQVGALQIDGRLTLDNMRIVRNAKGNIEVEKI